MRIIIQNTAHNSIENIFEYISKYSMKSAIETIEGIYTYIYELGSSPDIGRYIPEIRDKNFRELIYRKTKHSRYRIIYYISKSRNKIYIINIINCKQNFIRILKIHNFFKNFYEF